MAGRQMEGRVVPHVCGVDPRSSLDQHVHDICPTFPRRPVQEAKPVVITERQHGDMVR